MKTLGSTCQRAIHRAAYQVPRRETRIDRWDPSKKMEQKRPANPFIYAPTARMLQPPLDLSARTHLLEAGPFPSSSDQSPPIFDAMAAHHLSL